MIPATTFITLYKGAKDNKGLDIPLDKIIGMISGPSVASFIGNIRRVYKIILDTKKELETETDPEKVPALQQRLKEHQYTYDNLKKELPAVTWSGSFHKRLKTELKEYSGLICLDIDKLPTAAALAELKAFLKDDP